MYRPNNYYAARAAAIKEALENQRIEDNARAAKQHPPVPPIYTAGQLRQCGKKVPLTLGVFFGDRQGTVVDAMICYYISDNMFIAKYTEHMKVHIVEAAHYNKRDDIYYYAISEIAVL